MIENTQKLNNNFLNTKQNPSIKERKGGVWASIKWLAASELNLVSDFSNGRSRWFEILKLPIRKILKCDHSNENN